MIESTGQTETESVPLCEWGKRMWSRCCCCSCNCRCHSATVAGGTTSASARARNSSLWHRRCCQTALCGQKLFGARCRAHRVEVFRLPQGPQKVIRALPLPQHNFLLFPLLFLCYIFLFVALLKLSTRNAPSRFCKSNQNRNQMQIGIRLVCLRSLKRCITLSPSLSLAHSLSGGFNFKLDRHTVAGRECGWDGLRNCCENCDRFFTSPDWNWIIFVLQDKQW